MKSLFIFLLFFIKCSCIQECACEDTLSEISTKLKDLEHFITSKYNRYKLYPTENKYNFLKLDTATGRIEQVQWSLNDNEEFTLTLNGNDLSSFTSYNGMFELYPTKNIWQFILLDKYTGRQWHVQWGLESKKRWIQRIN